MKKILLALGTFLCAAISLVAAPKAVVFDWGGVVAQPDRSVIASFLCQTFHFSEADLDKTVKTGRLDSNFWLDLAKQKGIELPCNWIETYTTALQSGIGADPKMFALIDELKEEHVQVGLLSNVDDRYTKLLRSFGFYRSFNPCLLSCEIGCEKPDPKAFETLVQTLHLSAKEIVFIDDKIENVEAAKQKGIDALVFESPEQVRQELQKRGLLRAIK